MLQAGQFNSLLIKDVGVAGFTLDAGLAGELFLPASHPPDAGQGGLQPGESVRVFVYQDADGAPVATQLTPAVQVGECAWLKVAAVNQTGAFVDWGLPKDLLVPFAEQQHQLRAGQRAIVRAYLDKRGRITGSTRINRWIEDEAGDLRTGDPVELLVAERTELGFKAVVNHRYWGLLYRNELFGDVRRGQTLSGFVKRVREDGRLDLTLNRPGGGRDRVAAVQAAILLKLEAAGGRLELTDKSPPEDIYAVFGVSKKVFKQALGALYKQRLITLSPGHITRAAE